MCAITRPIGIPQRLLTHLTAAILIKTLNCFSEKCIYLYFNLNVNKYILISLYLRPQHLPQLFSNQDRA